MLYYLTKEKETTEKCRGFLYQFGFNPNIPYICIIKPLHMKIPYTATSQAIKGYSDSTLAKLERRDCVVRAIASAFDIQYDKAHKWVADTFNRKPKKGTYGFPQGMNKMSDDKTRMNYKRTKTIDPKHLTTNNGKSKMSVGTFAKLYNKGTYILRVTGHAFTIKDGSVIGNPNDANQVRKIVKNAWKIG